MRIPLHIGRESRTTSDYSKLAEHHAIMASYNPKGFRQFSTKKKKRNKRVSLAEFYAKMAGMF